MQVGLTRDELLVLIAEKASALTVAIRMAPSLMSGGITDIEIDEIVSRISALTSELFKEKTKVSQ